MPTEKEKMLAGELYNPADPQLLTERMRAHKLCQQFNQLGVDQTDARREIVCALFGTEATTSLTAPFFCDYGYNITLGENTYFNFNCVILDVMQVTIGKNTLCGPGVQIYTAMHPLDAAERRTGLEYAKPVSIGEDVWIGGGAIICPGVSIGSGCVIGAGSVVTKNIPDNVFAAGNPCRVIRPLTTT